MVMSELNSCHIFPFQIERLNQNLNFENVLICVLGYINNLFLNNSEMLDIQHLLYSQLLQPENLSLK